VHINELKFSLYDRAADYQPSRLAEKALNSMQLQHQQHQPIVKTQSAAVADSSHLVPAVLRCLSKLNTVTFNLRPRRLNAL